MVCWLRLRAIAIGAVVPASVMAIGASNLFTRNLYREYIRENISSTEETLVSKVGSMLVLLGALGFVIFAPNQYAITLQLAGGVWILQTLPALFLALYVRWLNRWALIAGWVAGIVWGTYGLVQEEGFSGSTHALDLGGFSATLYIGLYALVANLIIVFVVSALIRVFVSREQTSYGLLSEEDYKESERT